jgi:hypothetical protein
VAVAKDKNTKRKGYVDKVQLANKKAKQVANKLKTGGVAKGKAKYSLFIYVP